MILEIGGAKLAGMFGTTAIYHRIVKRGVALGVFFPEVWGGNLDVGKERKNFWSRGSRNEERNEI